MAWHQTPGIFMYMYTSYHMHIIYIWYLVHGCIHELVQPTHSDIHLSGIFEPDELVAAYTGIWVHVYTAGYIKSNNFIRAKRVSNWYIQKKKVCACACVHACTRVRLILVLVLSRQIVYGQKTVYLCLSKYIVFENTQLLAVQASCGEKHRTVWRLPTWCPKRQSPLVPSRTDSSNLHVI